MRAMFLTTGIAISLGEEDKQKKNLECILEYGKRPKVFLYILDSVEERGFMEEEGFHIQGYPRDVGMDECIKICIYLSEKNWKNLTTKYDSDAGAGYFESRCPYDRCSFYYWDKEMALKNLLKMGFNSPQSSLNSFE